MQRPLILHPTDLGPASDAAFRHALRIALAERGSLRLVHVHQQEHAGAAMNEFPHVRETLTRWGELAAGAPQAAVAERLGLEVSKAEVVATRPEPGLEHLVENEAPDLIVLGTRGEGEVEVSFAETLARHVHTPALIVPAGAAGFVGEANGAVGLKSILMPVTHVPDPTLALTLVARLVNVLHADAKLTLLHVGPAAESPRLEMPEGPRYALMVRDELPIAETIVKAADEVAADLIVMPTEGHNSLPDDLRGDTTEHVLRHAHRPVLAVPVG